MTDAPPPTGPPTGPPPTGPPTAGPPPTGPPPPSGPPTTPVDSGPTDVVTRRPLLDVGEWLTDTTRSLVHGFGEFFAVLTVVSLVSTGMVVPLLWFGSRSAVLTRADNGAFSSVEGLTTGEAIMVGVGIVVFAIAQVILFSAATVHVDRVRRNEGAGWRESLAVGLRRSPRVVGVVLQVVVLAFVLALVMGVAATLLPGAAIVIGPLSLLLLALIWVRCAVASTHAVLARPGSSLAASVAFTRGRTWPLLGRHILLITIALGILLISSFIATPFQSLGGAEAGAGDVVLRDLVGSSVSAFVAVQFINSLASGLVASVWASAMLSIYRSEPSGL